jgi:hypothetical protein
MAVELQLRRDTAGNIGSQNPLQGEVWMDTSANRLLLGTGAALPLPGVVPVGIPMSPNGATSYFAWSEVLVNLTSGSSQAFTLQLPSAAGQAIIFALACIVTTSIIGVPSFGIGTTSSSGSNPTNFGNSIAIAKGTQAEGIGYPAAYYGGNLYVNATSGTFTAGQVRISALILVVLPPTQ